MCLTGAKNATIWLDTIEATIAITCLNATCNNWCWDCKVCDWGSIHSCRTNIWSGRRGDIHSCCTDI